MNRKGKVYNNGQLAGVIEENDDGYSFIYDDNYLIDTSAKPICFAIPRRRERYTSKYLFPFFHGLLAEGIAKEIQCRKLKIDESDHFGRLLKTGGGDFIGSITVKEVVES